MRVWGLIGEIWEKGRLGSWVWKGGRVECGGLGGRDIFGVRGFGGFESV